MFARLDDEAGQASKAEPRPQPAAMPEPGPTTGTEPRQEPPAPAKTEPTTDTAPQQPSSTPLIDQSALDTSPPGLGSDATSTAAPPTRAPRGRSGSAPDAPVHREPPPEATDQIVEPTVPESTVPADANKSATVTGRPRRGKSWIAVAAGIVALAVAITISILVVPSKEDGPRSQEYDADYWIDNIAAVGMCFDHIGAEVEVIDCSEPNVLKVTKLTHDPSDCKNDSTNGYIQASNNTSYVCWETTPS
jgi:hypothetical protein